MLLLQTQHPHNPMFWPQRLVVDVLPLRCVQSRVVTHGYRSQPHINQPESISWLRKKKKKSRGAALIPGQRAQTGSPLWRPCDLHGNNPVDTAFTSLSSTSNIFLLCTRQIVIHAQSAANSRALPPLQQCTLSFVCRFGEHGASPPVQRGGSL